MRSTISSLLCQPLMIAPAAIPALLDEARADFQTTAPKREAPQVRCTLYGMDGQQLGSDDKRPAGSLVAVVGVSGVLTRHGIESWYGSTVGMLEIGRRLSMLDRDESIYAIVLAIDSPGGTVTGSFELSQLVYDIRQAGKTRIASVADALMASAAQAIGSAAGESYAIPSATVASIGVLSAYSDYSAYLTKLGITTTTVRSTPLKARFSGTEPLTPDMLDTLQATVDRSHELFVNTMARNRGVSPRHVSKRFGGGETLHSEEALSVGLIDGIVSSADEVVSSMIRDAATQGRRRR
jgi:capsid assembly protease